MKESRNRIIQEGISEVSEVWANWNLNIPVWSICHCQLMPGKGLGKLQEEVVDFGL